MSKNMTPAQVAAKIGKFKTKQEDILKIYPVGPMANSARINLNKAEAALASLQETNEGMRVGQQPQAQMGASMPNDMNYMQAKYGGFTMPKLADGGETIGIEGNSNVEGSTLMTPQLQDMVNTLMETYGWTEQNALMGASVSYKETKGVSGKENSYYNTSIERIRKVFKDNNNVTKMSDEKIQSLLDLADKDQSDAFFNHAYANILGNGDAASGDGSKFSGGGLVQFTGRNNFEAASKSLGLGTNLVDNPELITDPAIAGQLGAWWVGDKAGKTGLRDFDVTKDIAPADIPDFLNGVYATVSSGGSVRTKAKRDKLHLNKAGGEKAVYTEGMAGMQTFLDSVLPDMQRAWNNPDDPFIAPTKLEPLQGSPVDSTETAVANLALENSNLLIPESKEEVASGRADDTYEAEVGYDESPGEAPAEATVSMQDQLVADRFNPSTTNEDGTYRTLDSENAEVSMDLNFHRAGIAGGVEPSYTADKRFAYAQNEHGDWNVYDSQTNLHSMVRHENMLGEKGDSGAWRQAVASDGIAYDPQINGADTTEDRDAVFRYSGFGGVQVGPDGKPLDARAQMANKVASRQGGAAWGNEIDFETAIDGNIAAMGIEKLSFAESEYLKRPGWLSGKLTGYDKADLEARNTAYEEAWAKEAQIAYANPGSYEFTLTADDQKSYMNQFGDWLIDETIDSPIGQMAGLEPRGKEGSTQFRGVGGYDPFTDYLSYEAYDDALEMPTETAEQRTAQETAIKDSKALTNRYQSKGKTDNIIGNLFTPASLMSLEKRIGETFVQGSKAGGVKFTAADGVKRLGARGQGSLTGTARQNAIQSGKLQIGAAPRLGKPFTGLPKMANDYIPNTIPSKFIQNPITGKMAGSTRGIKDAFKTSGGLLDEYVPQLGDDFANTMGRSLDDFFPGAAKPGANLPGLKGFNPPATTGNFPALTSNLPSKASNLPGVTSRLPQNLRFGQNLGGRGAQGFQSYSILDDLGLAVGKNAGAQMGGVWQSALRDDYDPRRFGSLFTGDSSGNTPVDGAGGGEKGDGDGGDGGGDGDGDGTKINEGDWSTGGPDKYNLDMGNPSALMAIPGLAALASGQMQNNSLNRMSGPAKPITTNMPQFNYKSNIGQQLQEVKDASNSVMQNTNLQGQQAAALNQSVAAQRLKSNSGLLQQDAQQEQAARASYDAMSMQARMSNDALRNSYLQDNTNFNNKKEMLQTQARQQPLNVLASSAQDYLKNIYSSNLAAQMEAVGRPYDTGYDAEGNWIGKKE